MSPNTNFSSEFSAVSKLSKAESNFHPSIKSSTNISKINIPVQAM